MTDRIVAVTPDVAHALRAAAPASVDNLTIAGLPVVVSPHLRPSWRAMAGIDARRIVRHGLADVLAWLGEDVGPKPGEPAPAAAIIGNLADHFAVPAMQWETEAVGNRERMRAWVELPFGVTPADAALIVGGVV